MIGLENAQDYWIVYGLAAVLGAVGGIVADLLLRGKAGKLEIPHKTKSSWDLGFISEVIVGAAAAAAFVWFLPTATVNVEGNEIRAYDIRALVGASIVVGTAGGSIIAAMAERATALVVKRDTAKALDDTISELTSSSSAITAPPPPSAGYAQQVPTQLLPTDAHERLETMIDRLREIRSQLDEEA